MKRKRKLQYRRSNSIFVAETGYRMRYFGWIQWLETHQLSCPVKTYSGMDCPGCGLQRSLILLLKGDVVGSVVMYPSTLPILFLFLFVVTHLRFNFYWGAKAITITYIIIAVVTMIHYIYNLSTGQVFH